MRRRNLAPSKLKAKARKRVSLDVFGKMIDKHMVGTAYRTPDPLVDIARTEVSDMLKRDVAAMGQAVFPTKPPEIQDFGFGLPFDQVREAVRFWLASKGVYVVGVKR